MIDNTQHVTVVILCIRKFRIGVTDANAGALRQALALCGQCICRILHNKFVEARTDGLNVLSGEHPAIFGRVVSQVVVVTRVSTAIVHTEFQRATRVQFQTA